MTAATASRPLQTPAAVGFEVGTLESALLRSRWQLRFDAALEERYERDTGAGRTMRHVVCNLLGAVAFWFLSMNDATRLPEIGLPLGSLRWAVTFACLGVVALPLLWRSSLRGWQRETATAFGTLLIVGYTLFVTHHVSTTDQLLQLSGILLIFLHVGIGARLQFGFALVVNLLSYLGFAALAHGDSISAARVVDNLLLVCGSVLLFVTVGNHLLEFRERRSYLLQCLKARHHESLLIDAELLRQLTERDPLTKLFNRRHFDAQLALAWQAGLRNGCAVGLLQIDVDHFKAYNDRYGHPAGDRCLAQVGAALQAAAERAGGIAARVGGEEFALLLPGLGQTEIDTVATDACVSVRALALAHEDSRPARRVTVSVGAASARPVPGVRAAALVGAADAALYVAKREGRDRWALADAPLAQAPPSRVRPAGGDSLAPEAEETADDLVWIDRLSELLAKRLLGLRFPVDLETTFQEHDATRRRQLLTGLAAAGLAMVVGYVWICAPVLGNVADLLLTRMTWLAGTALAATAISQRLRFGWRAREGTLSAITGVMGICIVWTEAKSDAPTVYAAALGLCLLPMFSSMIAAQPIRFSLVPSVLICGAFATLMAPALAAQRASWLYTLGVICVATLYALVCGYLLDRSNRRAFLLDRLRVAQLAVLRRNTAHLQRLATLDPLTRLPNRRHFDAELDRLTAVCMAARQPLALLILDIDHFKRYNDGYGHPAGDACLQRIGAALAQWARNSTAPSLQLPGASQGMAARIGGEEFGVLLPGSDGSAALAVAHRLRHLLLELRIEHEHSPVGRFLTVSIGVASLMLGSAGDTRQLLATADAALYRAKGLGRDRAAA